MNNLAHSSVRPSPLGIAAAFVLVCGSATAGPTLQYGEQGSITLGYALQGWTQYREFTSPTDSGATTDTFLRRNRITLTGQYSDYVGYYAQLDTGSDSRGGNDDEPVFFRDAYLTLDYSDPVRLIYGRFKNTFSRENLEACLEPLTMDRAEVLSFTPFAGSRDTGIALWGNLADATLQYRVMIADGREGDEIVSDSPRLTTRVHWSPWDPEYNYGYRGTYLGTQEVLTIGASYDMQEDVAYGDFANRADPKDYSAWTVDLFVEYPTAAGTPTFSAAMFDYSVDNAINESPDTALSVASWKATTSRRVISCRSRSASVDCSSSLGMKISTTVSPAACSTMYGPAPAPITTSTGSN